MAGLLLIVVLGIWTTACAAFASWITSKLKPNPFRPYAGITIFILAFLLPVADELLARPQLASLCSDGAALKIDAEKIKGKTVRLDISPSNRQLEGTLIPILHSHFSYRDATTGEEYARYDVYRAKGGFMSRLIGFPEGSPPWTMEQSSCVPPDEGSLSKNFGFSLIN